MHAIMTATRRKRPNPLDKMIHSTAGSRNLPVEIWEDIFRMTCAQVVLPARLENELQTAIPGDMPSFCESPTILSEFFELQNPELFRTRRSIALVCKAWYDIVIPVLWSHIRINLDTSVARLQTLSQVLKANQAFASSVKRLSIEGGNNYASTSSKIVWPKEKDRAFEKIASRLTNLRIITCPHNLARGYHSCLHPDIGIIYHDPRNHTRVTYDSLAYANHFWYHSQTLYFTFPGEPWFPTRPRSQRFIFPTFPNLVHLKLEVTEFTTTEWITGCWDLPRLRTLSISSPRSTRWIKFIAKFHLSLEALEILLIHGFQDMTFDHRQEPLTFPKLKAYCLSIPLYTDGSNQIAAWIKYVNAPILHRFSFHARFLMAGYGEAIQLRERMATACQYYPTVKVLGLNYHEGGNPLLVDEEDGFPIVGMADVITWCDQGYTVEVTRSGGKDKTIYTKEKGVTRL